MIDFTKFVGESCIIPTKKWGKVKFESIKVSDAIDGDAVLFIGKQSKSAIPLVRIHSICLFSEVFQSEICDCAHQLSVAMDLLKAEGNGILFYLRMDARGAGLSAKIKATELEMQGMDCFDSRIAIGVHPDNRDYSEVGMYLKGKGFSEVRLLTNNPEKIHAIEKAGIIVHPVSLIVESSNSEVRRLYQTKIRKFKHQIPESYRESNVGTQLSLF